MARLYELHRQGRLDVAASASGFTREHFWVGAQRVGGWEFFDERGLAPRPGKMPLDTFKAIVDECMGWPGKPVTRHNDASLLMHKLAFLADWGVKVHDEGIRGLSKKILSNTSSEGALQSLINVPESYGGSGAPTMGWMLCDAPLLLYSLIQFDLRGDPAVEAAINHLIHSASPNGWRCLNSLP
jgi:hypothetical protein